MLGLFLFPCYISVLFTKTIFPLIGSWPFLVSLQLQDKLDEKFEHQCGGSIINEYQVLTAAHCFKANHGYERSGKLKNNKNPNLVTNKWIVLTGNNIHFWAYFETKSVQKCYLWIFPYTV